MQVRTIPATLVNMLVPGALTHKVLMCFTLGMLSLQAGYSSRQRSLCQLSHPLPA
jgi:hypothetical protein